MIRQAQVNGTPTGAIARATLARAAVVTTYDDDGRILSHEVSDPPPPRTDAATPGTAPGSTPAASERGPTKSHTAADLRLMADRLDVCTPCPEFGGAGLLTVRCNGCGCAGLSLKTGTCKLGKWRKE